ncbi:MAG: 3-oxoacyl-ACP synthase III, partial [Xanthomonadales bacterium]|nr:3-oxoacyl-ACP synthase III [Xanthomonadales bacterium]
ERDKVGILVNTSVCRDFLEPSTASIVAGKLGLPEQCRNFDVGNACLAFLNGMDIAAHMIERGDIEYALIVDGECSRYITEKTIERLSHPSVTPEQFRDEFASLTLGSGGVAMLLANADLYPDGHRYLGSVSRSATQFSKLCAGNIDRMVTDTKTLLIEGLKLAGKTFGAARQMFGWAVGEIDEFVIHQVSRVHTEELVKLLGIDPRKVLTIFPEFGNIGPASLPTALSKLKDTGRLVKGKRVALLGIGSGLNCSMAEVVW